MPEKFEAEWRPYARNFLSVMARQPGLVAEEILRSLENPHRGVAIRSFVGKEESYIGPEWQPPMELKLATVPARENQVYDNASFPSKRLDFQVFDVVWGLSGPKEYEEFMGSLTPV